MPAAITEFVDVNLTVADAVAEKFSFGSLLKEFEHTITANRQDGPFFSQAEGVAAGFTLAAAPEIYEWLGTVFSQENGVDKAYVGRKVAAGGDPVGFAVQVDADGGPSYVDLTTAANNATVGDVILFPATEAIGDWFAVGHNEKFGILTFDAAGGVAGAGGGVVAWEYWNGTAWTALTGVSDGTSNFEAGATDGQQVTFTAPVDWVRTTINGSASLYFVRARVTTVWTTNPEYDQVFVGGDATLAAALDAIEAWDPTSYYFFNIKSRVAADIAAAAAWAESRNGDNGLPKYFIPQSDDPDFLNGVGGNIGETLQSSTYHRSALIYHATDGEHLDGAWASKGGGFNLDAPAGGNGGQGQWAYLPLSGVPFDPMTGAQANAIFGVNGNIFGRLKGLNFSAKGTAASGRFIDTTVSNDWVKVRIQEELIGLQVRTPTKIPYTNGGISLMVAAIRTVLQRGVTYGHISPDVPIIINAPDVSEVSVAEKAARQLTLTASYTLAGGIIKIVLNVAVAI